MHNNGHQPSSPWLICIAGAAAGVAAALLQKLGNPGNMGISVTLMGSDIAGAIGLHREVTAQYIRPELIGLGLGALASALAGRAFRPRGGASTLIHFILGYFAAVGALVFIGGPWRTLLRLAGGDGTALAGLAGLLTGITAGSLLIKAGFTMGEPRKMFRPAGIIFSVFMLMLLALGLRHPVFPSGVVFASTTGAASTHAPFAVSLVAGLIVGILAQRSRLCTIASMRNLLLARETTMILGAVAIFVGALALNFCLGQVRPGFTEQPFAHGSHLWSFLAMALCGLSLTLAGGDPLRQVVMAGEGDMDAAACVFGMLAGAAFAHNLGMAATQAGPGPMGPWAVGAGLIICTFFGFVMRSHRLGL